MYVRMLVYCSRVMSQMLLIYETMQPRFAPLTWLLVIVPVVYLPRMLPPLPHPIALRRNSFVGFGQYTPTPEIQTTTINNWVYRGSEDVVKVEVGKFLHARFQRLLLTDKSRPLEHWQRAGNRCCWSHVEVRSLNLCRVHGVVERRRRLVCKADPRKCSLQATVSSRRQS